MANMNVTFADMQGAATRLRTGQEELNGVLARLKADVDNLVASGFVTDRASVTFQGSYDAFTQGAVTTVSGLEGMQSFLDQAANSLAEVDQQLARSIGG